MAKGGFPLSHGCVKFTFSNKIEAMLEWSWMVARKSKSWTSLNFTYKLNTLYPASILFTRVKISCLQTHAKVTRKRKPTLNLSTGITFSEIPSVLIEWKAPNILLIYITFCFHTCLWLSLVESAGVPSERSWVRTPAWPNLRVFK